MSKDLPFELQAYDIFNLMFADQAADYMQQYLVKYGRPIQGEVGQFGLIAYGDLEVCDPQPVGIPSLGVDSLELIHAYYSDGVSGSYSADFDSHRIFTLYLFLYQNEWPTLYA